MNPTSPEFQRLEVLRAFKQRMRRPNADENISPFDDRVTTAHGNVTDYDLSDIHAEVRQRIGQTIEAVRSGTKKSQVILLAGDAGAGKTHLLRTLQPPECADRLGYVYVGGSNHWSVGEFQARLLDWMIEALTVPSPAGNHLLLERVQAIGFKAIDHLLANQSAWRECRARREGGWLGRLKARLRPPSFDALEQAAADRSAAAFEQLDFTRFGGYVCDRFLADRSNPTHRYALRVLLTYLFPEPHETGVGPRERVVHWFRRKPGDGYFKRRLGVDESLDRQFTLFEAVKLLVHLFSPAVSKELSAGKAPCPPRVFLLVFDQAEGRHELFESDQDWLDFFAHLSELYNTLPNVVVLFTMTLGLRNRLHGLMERQFKDRIRMDEKYWLQLPEEAQVLELYRSRVSYWLQNNPDLLDRYRGLSNPYEPFTRERLWEIAARQTLRDTLEAFNRAFHEKMGGLVVEPEFDFHFHLNALRPLEPMQGEFDYTAAHLTTVRELLLKAGTWLGAEYGVALQPIDEVEGAGPPVLQLVFRHPFNEKARVTGFLVRLGYQFKSQLAPARERLANRKRARHFMYLLRASKFDPDTPADRREQVFDEVIPPSLESRLRALTRLAEKQQDYEQAGLWTDARSLIRKEFDACYLGRVFREAQKRLEAIHVGQGSQGSDSAEEESPTAP